MEAGRKERRMMGSEVSGMRMRGEWRR